MGVLGNNVLNILRNGGKKKTVILAVLLGVLVCAVLTAYGTEKVRVYATGDTTFRVENITNQTVRNIVVDVSINYGPNSSYAGSIAFPWRLRSLGAGEGVTVNIFNDLDHAFVRGANIRSVKLKSCD
jgi:hypothetical protein